MIYLRKQNQRISIGKSWRVPNDVMCWFAADHHFGHNNVIRYDDRPFDNVDQMGEVMVQRHNERVGKDDLVFFIGDLFWNQRSRNEYLPRLNGRKVLIYGNHDQAILNHPSVYPNFEMIHPLLTVVIQGQRIRMCHEPIFSWVGRGKGVWHLHGHIHKNYGVGYPEESKILNVGVTEQEYAPLSFNVLKLIMDTKNDS